MLKTTANKITVGRILLVPLFLALAYGGHKVGALVVYIIACVSDAADGYIARHHDQISTVGKFMDPLADKMLVLSAMCCFVDNGQMPGWALAIVLFREFAVSGLRLCALGQGKVIAAARSGKVKTACTMAALAVMLVFGKHNLVNIISTVLILITTVYSGVQYFIVNQDVLKS